MTQKKAIIYVRVSTDEQADKGYSLKHQEERLRNYCSIQGIEVVGFYREDHSAKTFDRPQFKRLLEFLKKNKRFADYLLFLKWDRFSRNAGDAYFMINTLNKLAVEPQAIEQPLDLSIPENKIMLAFYLAAPEVENDRRALNTIAGLRRARKEGRWVAKAPIGYLNARNERNQPIVNVDAKLAPVVRWVFEEIANGVYSAETIRKKAREKELNCTKSNFFILIKNPFYCGKIFIPAYKDEEAQFVQGIHEPLISESLFYDTQLVMSGRRRNFPTKQTAKKELPLRGFLLCDKCGGRLTGSASKGRSAKYFYYHCTPQCGERHKAEEVNIVVGDEMLDIASNKQSIQLFKHEYLDLLLTGGKEVKEMQDKVRVEVLKNKERLSNAQQLLLDGSLDPNDYKEIKNRYEPIIRDLESRLGDTTEANLELERYLKFGVFFFENLDQLYFDGDLILQQQVVGSIFPQKTSLGNLKSRTATMNLGVSLICRPGKDFSGSKNKKTRKNAGLSSEAPPVGLEPTTL